MRRCLTFALALLPAAAGAQGPVIEHQPVKCLVVGQYSLLSACLTPSETVAQARVYFRPEGVPSWHFVNMKRAEQCFAGVLPKPTKALVGHTVEYYLEGADQAFAVGRTGQNVARVVQRAHDCGDDPVAAFSPHGPDAVFPTMPPGFASLSGGIGTGTVLAVVGAGVAGGGAALAVGKDGDRPNVPRVPEPTGTQPQVPGSNPPNDPPALTALRVACEADPRAGPVPLRVKFLARPAGGNGVYDFFWQFGDGGTSNQVTPGHTYETAGTFTAVVRVTSGGQTATCDRVISAGPTTGSCERRVAPSTAIVSPSPGSTVTGPTVVSASASASVEIDRVEFYARDVATGTSSLVGIDSGAPFQATWNPPASCGGGFELHSLVVDVCGGATESTRTAVIARTDTLPPVVSGVAAQDPTPASLDCNENVAVVANATDNLGVVNVTLFADGASLGVDASAPYSAPWTVPTGPSPTSRILRAEARDACGNVGVGQATVSVSCLNTLTLTKAGAAGGTVADDQAPRQIDCGPGCASDTGSYGFGTVVTLTATPAPGARFAGWGGACTAAQGPCVVTMDLARSVTATFEPAVFTLTVTKAGNGQGTVTSTPGGINCGPGCATQSASFLVGTVVSLAPQPAGNSTFVAWGGDCTGRVCQVTMDQNRSVTADFALLTFTLNVTSRGGGTVTGTGINCGLGGTDCTEVFPIGTVVSLLATPGSIASFEGWSGAVPAACTPPQRPFPLTCAVTMDQSRDVVADFFTGPSVRGSGSAPDSAGPLGSGGLTWLSDLSVPGAAGQVMVNGQVAAAALPGTSAALLAVRPGENRVEARLTQAGGRPGLWRFELQEKGRIEPGSLRILQGEVTQVTGDAVAFRLRGQPGETVAFSFRLAP